MWIVRPPDPGLEANEPFDVLNPVIDRGVGLDVVAGDCPLRSEQIHPHVLEAFHRRREGYHLELHETFPRNARRSSISAHSRCWLKGRTCVSTSGRERHEVT